MRIVLGMVMTLAMLLTIGCAPSTPTVSPEPVEVQILVRGLMPPTEQSLVVGDEVRISDTGTVLGTISEVNVEPALLAVPDNKGVLREARSPILVDVQVTIEGEAALTDQGFKFGEQLVYVNNDLRYGTTAVQFAGLITGIRAADSD